MNDTIPAAVQTAIDTLLDRYRTLADQERELAVKRHAEQVRIDQLLGKLRSIQTFDPEQVTPEMFGAFAYFEQHAKARMQNGDMAAIMDFARFPKTLLEGMKAYFVQVKADTESGDPDKVRAAAQKLLAIQTAATGLSEALRVPPLVVQGMPTFDVVIAEPEQNYGTWSYAVVVIDIDENYNVSLMKDFGYDIYLTAFATPTDGLHEEFNSKAVAASKISAHEPLKPWVFQCETSPENPVRTVHFGGAIYQDKMLRQSLDFGHFRTEKKESGFDVEAFLNAVGPDGWSAGPG